MLYLQLLVDMDGELQMSPDLDVLLRGKHIGYIDAWVHISVLGNILKILQQAKSRDEIHRLLQVRCGIYNDTDRTPLWRATACWHELLA